MAVSGGKGSPDSGPLVGRDVEVRRVTAAIEEVEAGYGAAVLLAGDPGIGKSRLAHEALDLAAARGFTALVGRAHLLHRGLAYAPVVEALSPRLEGLDRARQVKLLDGLDDLGRLFPALPVRLPDSIGDPALEKLRLFEAVTRLLGRLAGEHPVVLLIEDLHWADRASLELLHYLVRGTADRPVLVLGTFRPAQLGAPEELGHLVASFRAEGHGAELKLGPLPSDAIAAVVEQALGARPPESLVADVVARAGGVPLFATALVRSFVESRQLTEAGGRWTYRPAGGRGVPAEVRDAVLAVLPELAPAERSALEVVAVCGSGADPAVVENVLSALGESADQALRHLLAARLVVEDTHEGGLVYRVGHPLYGEVAYDSLGEIRRRRLHALVVGELEDRRPDDVLALAPHYLGAGELVDAVRALRVLETAGGRAASAHAHEEAAALLAAALNRARLHRPDRRAGLLEKLGAEYEGYGAVDDATAAWEEAIAAYLEASNESAAGRLHWRLALLYWDAGDPVQAETQVRHGIRLLENQPPSSELVELHYTQVRLLTRLGDHRELRLAIPRLRAVAEASGSRSALVTSALARADLAVFDDDYKNVRLASVEALELATEIGNPLHASYAHRMLALQSCVTGELALADRHASELLAMSREGGRPSLESVARVVLGTSAWLRGDWDDALREFSEAHEVAVRVGAARQVASALACRSFVLALRGGRPAVEACLRDAEKAYGELGQDRRFLVLVEYAGALLSLQEGAPDRVGPLEGLLAMPSPHLLVPVLMAFGESRALLCDEAALDAVLGRLRLLGRYGAFPSFVALRIEGLLARTQGRSDDAAALLSEAADGFAELSMGFEAARARLEWAEVVAPQGAVDGLTDQVSAGLELFGTLRAAHWTDRSRRLLRTLGVRVPQPRSRSGAALTPRELEIALLVGDGLTNTEIAERLFLSARTVGTHLQHIYERLGIRSRVALARWTSENAQSLD
ncbi:ATP-binding protein [Tenggerimyces flavus]|uniref:ATP-binding protein n=1 Tax=Tenggerimyces flavus TaxID=1708749 RepID=A0ABV7Y3Y0_9ACTN|nr:LuxR family transcriptional regulator [Tenggerimyces flavus]MBM7790659.1 DNA-binding CsgD family transcriptional regulator/tetratricopeptide (TPR) repeat protein [Tenggerimyces flavus]